MSSPPLLFLLPKEGGGVIYCIPLYHCLTFDAYGAEPVRTLRTLRVHYEYCGMMRREYYEYCGVISPPLPGLQGKCADTTFLTLPARYRFFSFFAYLCFMDRRRVNERGRRRRYFDLCQEGGTSGGATVACAGNRIIQGRLIRGKCGWSRYSSCEGRAA